MLKYYPKIRNIVDTSVVLKSIMVPTPLNYDLDLSNKYNANIHLKREDLTPVRSYKIRGAFNKMNSLQNKNGIVSCSAGNHAQGVALSCNKLKIKGDIHPFDDEKVIEGQATVGLEILNDLHNKHLDYLFLPIGGGGLAAGVSTYIKQVSPVTKIIGVEPLGAPSMYEAFKQNKVIKLDKINTFVDGASVKKVGDLNYPICKKNLDDIILIDEGHVCSKILEMYNDKGIIIEPAGVLSLCALDIMNEDIKNKTCVSVISGGNSDVFRMPEIMERSLIYEGRKHYFKIEFAQKAGALREFVMSVLGPNDDIIFFKYTKLINRETGPVLIGIETKHKSDVQILIKNMEKCGITYEKLTNISDF